MRDRDPVAEEGRGLLLARQHTVYVAIGHVTGADQRGGDLPDGLFFITGLLAGMNILHR